MDEASTDDGDLLRRIGRGDRGAFEAFYGRHAPWVAVRLRRRCRDDGLVAEVLQDTFLAVWRAAGGYAGRGEPAAWVWTIASRRLVDAFRRRAARPALRTGGEPVAASAEEVSLAGEYDAPLSAALARLSPQLRAVLQATVLDGLTTRETAVLLDVPEGTVKTWARRARLQLREALG